MHATKHPPETHSGNRNGARKFLGLSSSLPHSQFMHAFRLLNVCLGAVAAFALPAAGAEAKKPNILFIVGDDMGYADVGFQHCKDIPTPNLDSLAKSGVQFTSGYVSAPYCSPTRAGL